MGLFKRWRRRRLARRPFPDLWRQWLKRHLAYYRLLTPEEQNELHRHIQVFLAEKRFEGCGGLKLTDEIRLTIAAQACLLLLNRETDYYPGLVSIVVYPDTFLAPVRETLPGGVQFEGEEARSGESWGMGTVVLSWSEVDYGTRDITDGQNVVLHEFAHQLDQEDGEANGTPRLSDGGYRAWAKALGAEYESFLEDLDADRPTLLDEYAATNPAEFFAVLTEAFFETPHRLRERHPDAYALLMKFYRQDPSTRFPSGTSR